MNKKIIIKKITHIDGRKLSEKGSRNATIMLGKLRVKQEKIKGNKVVDVEIICDPNRPLENQLALF